LLRLSTQLAQARKVQIGLGGGGVVDGVAHGARG